MNLPLASPLAMIKDLLTLHKSNTKHSHTQQKTGIKLMM